MIISKCSILHFQVDWVYTVTILWLDDKSDTNAIGVNLNGVGGTADDLNITDDVDGTDDVVVSGNEANFKQLTMSFEP
ncbi:MAG: hypothetical protein LC437_02295 [Thiohalomonas sp.]|nr:hypothetical protein [Thiohalomonas sp.]